MRYARTDGSWTGYGDFEQSLLETYEEVDPKLRDLVEDVILNRNDEATEKLIDFADKIKNGVVTQPGLKNAF